MHAQMHGYHVQVQRDTLFVCSSAPFSERNHKLRRKRNKRIFSLKMLFVVRVLCTFFFLLILCVNVQIVHSRFIFSYFS